MAVTFSRKPAYAAAAPASGGSVDLRAKLMAALSNPYISASGAACLFLAFAATMVILGIRKQKRLEKEGGGN